MHRKTDFTQLDGIDFSQDLADFLQGQSEHLSRSIAALMGDKAIVRGVVNTNGTISDGLVVYKDEVLPLIGGSIATHVDVDEMLGTELFGDGNQRAVSKTRVLRLVSISTPTSFPFSDLVRPGQLKSQWLKNDIKQVACKAAYIAANFDLTTGEGLPTGERAGWKIKFSAGGRVLVGYTPVADDPNDNVWDAAYTVPGSIGGEKLHQLVTQELPRHRFQFTRSKTNQTGQMIESNSMKNGSDRGLYAEVQYTDFIGDDQKHENRMPFEVVLTIEKM